MAETVLSGLGVALVTPFKQDLSIDFFALKNLIDYIINGGCDYLVALGTTAETPTLSSEEKILLADFIKETVDKRVPLVIGIGGNNTAAVVEELNIKDFSGYSAILSVTPCYNKPSQEGLFCHYAKIAENSPLPVILYNVPNRTGVNLEAETTISLAKNFDNIIGIKEASGIKAQIRKIIKEKPDRFMVISGDDSATFDIINDGGCGVISVMANAFPQKIKDLTNFCVDGNIHKARQLQDSHKDLIHYIFKDGNPSGIKFALSELNLIQNVLRLPLVPVSYSTAVKIKELMFR